MRRVADDPGMHEVVQLWGGHLVIPCARCYRLETNRAAEETVKPVLIAEGKERSDDPSVNKSRRAADIREAAMRRRTRAALTLLALASIGLAALSNPAPAIPPVRQAETDFAAFRAVVGKLRAGSSYYPSMGSELRSRGYPTRDVFNWRTPLHLSAVSAMPDAVGRALLVSLLGVLCWATMTSVRQPFNVTWTTSSVMQVGVLVLLTTPSLVFLGEAWAGVLVGISLCAYARRHIVLAVGLGLLALFIRELAAPYCVVCAMIAALKRRWWELGAWVGGACAYAVYYGLHLTQVWAHRLPTDFSHSSTWLAFGGLPFLQATIHWSGWLFVLPIPFTALALVLVVAGVGSERAPIQLRASSAAYAVFFLIAGHAFNHYWGLMVGPTWALAYGYGVGTTVHAIRTAFGPPGSTD